MTDPHRVLLTNLIDRLTNNPERWCQNGCRDEDGRLCAGALAADLSGGRWADGPGRELGGYLLAEPDDRRTDVIRLIHPHDRARRILGIDIDLGDGLTLDQLRELTR